MKRLLLLMFCLSGCCTRIDSGNFHFVTYSNAAHLVVVGPSVRFEATELRNSTATAAAFYGISHALGAAGTAALPFAGGPAILRAAPIVPAAIPAVRQ